MTEETTQPATMSSKVAVIAEIVRQLGTPTEEVQAINKQFSAIVEDNPGTTILDLVKLCGTKYDHEAFLIGAMVSATVIELVNTVNTQKMAEVARQDYAGVEFM